MQLHEKIGFPRVIAKNRHTDRQSGHEHHESGTSVDPPTIHLHVLCIEKEDSRWDVSDVEVLDVHLNIFCVNVN